MTILLSTFSVNAQTPDRNVRAEPQVITMGHNEQATVSVISNEQIQDVSYVRTPRLVSINIFYRIINSIISWFVNIFSNNEGQSGTENVELQATTNNNGNINISLFNIIVNVNSNNNQQNP